MGVAPHAPVRTFLIADIRGYTRFTEEYGDEASARLARKFSELVQEGGDLRGGTLIEVRGDEALAVFDSARQAIRAGMDLQRKFAAETDADSDLPLSVGIGIDSGEAIALEDGSFRGAALNVAARLCALAHGGEVLVTEGTSHLAGRLPGVRYIDRGRVHLKGIADPVRVVRAAPEEEQTQSRFLTAFSGPKRLGWGLGGLVVLIAAATAAGVVYLTGENKGPESSAAPPSPPSPLGSPRDASHAGVIAVIPAGLRKPCVKQPVPNIGAVETAVCVQPSGATDFWPDRWEISIYPNGRAVREAYEAERRRQQLPTGQGTCSRVSWGGEAAWSHGPNKPGGRVLCYFDGDDAVAVWSHERLGQPTHRDILGIAREGGTDHARLYSWWSRAHHLIGKVE
ncbi:MAG TPA: adenylate/guanylate cyclase domain-containing protein [Gaiellaceae bacterium]|nr:adenylate/guanylate cyclase domain-containing protein [Gaiellaceae bacterium]